ncbi:hypothetical protein NEF87_000157 [Candidatus Lokiarchaeum ossiferum]|uniref:Methyltransferase type 11 domain-containing protein n=1 Tax=Candidatus Lokiarchaeum ossiferum TaxID=2951803 RepID=A0ABY6HLV2_9ARCH|nr:hypothetical protein NEF87_000157 [Candidatus Lokiarchaeum sp. B-35]
MSPRKNNRPDLDEYFGLEAEAYGTSQWMARNQIHTTETALNMLEDEQIGGIITNPKHELLFLDIGCGTGYSSHTILAQGSRVIGVDFSHDMLDECPTDPNLHLINADMRFIPLRTNQVDHVISISAFNFAAAHAKTRKQMEQQIGKAFQCIQKILKNHGHIVIEFYPTKLEEEVFLSTLRRYPFIGGMYIMFPNTKKEKKFLMLQLKKK